MAGSALAGRLLAPALNVRVERYMQAVFAVSAVALFVPVIFNRTKATGEADSLKADAPGERPMVEQAFYQRFLAPTGTLLCVGNRQPIIF